jgi:hypothetical protein
MLTCTDVSKHRSAFVFCVNSPVVTFLKTCIFSVIICLTEQHSYFGKLATHTTGLPSELCRPTSVVYTHHIIW